MGYSTRSSGLVVLVFFTAAATFILLMSTIMSSFGQFPNGRDTAANLPWRITNARQLIDHPNSTSSDDSKQHSSVVSEEQKYSPAEFPDEEPTAGEDYLADDTTGPLDASDSSKKGKSTEKKNMNTSLIIIGVVVIFLAIGITLFFLRNGVPGAGSKDERPLLTLLSMSDSSEGYSKPNLGYGSSSNMNMTGGGGLASFKTVDGPPNPQIPSVNPSLGVNHSFANINPTLANNPSFAQSAAVEEVSAGSKPPLPPPPAMVASMRRYGHPMPSFSANRPLSPANFVAPSPSVNYHNSSPAVPGQPGYPLPDSVSAASGFVPPASAAAIGSVSTDTTSAAVAPKPGPSLPPPPGGIPKPNLKEPPPVQSSPIPPQGAQASPTPPQAQASPTPPPPSVPKAPAPRGPPPPGPPVSGRGPPPPPMKGGSGPRPPPPKGGAKKAPPGPKGATDDGASKTKLKPFFWDKVLASPDQQMVWHEISSGSFQFNEEMIESLFGVNNAKKGQGKKEASASESAPQVIRIIEPKKAQNLSILLKALNVGNSEIYEAIEEGNELPIELINALLKMTPTQEEELKLRLYNDDLSKLGVAERFLKRLIEIPFCYKRLSALLFMGTLKEDVASINESFSTLEVACAELKNNRLFLKLLEAVLKTGNRMNDGTYRGGAQAFKLDTLLKLADVKGTDGKTTLLHFVVQEIIRSEGMRAARMARQSESMTSINSEDLNLTEEPSMDSVDHLHSLGVKVFSNLGNELENVKKAAILDVEGLTSSVANLGEELLRTKEFVMKDMKSTEEQSGFTQSLTSFVEYAEIVITTLLQDEKRIRALLKSTTDYFHGSSGGKDEGVRLFGIVRDILGLVEKICREIDKACKDKAAKKPPAPAPPKTAPVNNTTDQQKPTPPTSQLPPPSTQPHVPDPKALLFPAIKDQRAAVSSSSSDDD